MKYLENIDTFEKADIEKDIQMFKDIFDSFEEDYLTIVCHRRIRKNTIKVLKSLRVPTDPEDTNVFSKLEEELWGYLLDGNTSISDHLSKTTDLEKITDTNEILRRIKYLTEYKMSQFSKFGSYLIISFEK